jgi:hypothetical protein
MPKIYIVGKGYWGLRVSVAEGRRNLQSADNWIFKDK